MKLLLPTLLVPAFSLSACISFFSSDAPDPAGDSDLDLIGPAAAAPAATTVAVPAVTAFEGLTYDGNVLGVWTAGVAPQWSVRSVASGESVTVEETFRTACCIHFEESDGGSMVADFDTMEVQFGGSALPIGTVVQ